MKYKNMIKITNKELQDKLKKYPDDYEIIINDFYGDLKGIIVSHTEKFILFAGKPTMGSME